MGYVPQAKDRLGGLVGRGASIYPRTSPYPAAIPNNESVMVVTWFRYAAPPAVDASAYLFYVADTAVGLDQFYAFSVIAETLRIRTRTAGGIQNTADFTCSPGDHCLVALIDRVNTRLRVWLDSSLVADDALVRDPQWGGGTNGTWLYSLGTALVNSTTIWRTVQMSFAVGSVPTLAQWAEWLRPMRDPDAAVHASILAMKGTRHDDWKIGEGVYGSATIVSTGTTATPMVWQGGGLVQTVRTRARTPWRRPRRTFYGPKANEGGASWSGDYSVLAGQPIVARFIVKDLSLVTPNIVCGIDDTHGTNYIEISNVAGVMAVRVRCAGGAIQALPLVGDQLLGGDFWIECDGLVGTVYLNGQVIGLLALTAALNLSGDNHYQVVGIGGTTCRGAVWNPAVVPATLETEIRNCVCNPELDPVSLDRKVHDWPWSSLTLPLPTTINFLNQGCLVTWPFALSGQRQNVAQTVFTGTSP